MVPLTKHVEKEFEETASDLRELIDEGVEIMIYYDTCSE